MWLFGLTVKLEVGGIKSPPVVDLSRLPQPHLDTLTNSAIMCALSMAGFSLTP